jgi:hypothetical protein
MNIKLLILVTMYILVSYVIFQGGIGLNVAQMIKTYNSKLLKGIHFPYKIN